MSVTFDDLNDPKLIELIKQGAIGVIPTDTVYGLVCLAADQAAAGKLYGLKKRENKPGTIIAASIDQLEDLGLKHRYLKAVEDYWPNPISIVIPTGDELKYLHLGVRSLAVRLPSEPLIHELLNKTGPLLTTSANHPDQPEAATIAQAKKFFAEEANFYVDGGDLSGRQSSTVIRVIDDAVEVLREGAVKIDPESGEIKK